VAERARTGAVVQTVPLRNLWRFRFETEPEPRHVAHVRRRQKAERRGGQRRERTADQSEDQVELEEKPGETVQFRSDRETVHFSDDRGHGKSHQPFRARVHYYFPVGQRREEKHAKLAERVR